MNIRLLLPLFCLLSGCEFISFAQTPGGSPPVNAVADSGAKQNTGWTEAKPGIPKGKVELFSVSDKRYNRNRKVWVYTPPGYNPESKVPYRLLICFDGEDYINDLPAPVILDNLLAAGKIQPTVAVMVDNSQARLEDLANRAAFAGFMGDELVPWVRKNYRVVTDADKTILCGYSAGGLAAAYVAWKRPDLFGNVLSQSGAFWRGNEGGSETLEWLTEQFKNSPKLPLRFYIEVGAMETGKTAGGPVFIEATRRLRQVLEAKGYDVRYLEIEGARHEPAHWRSQLADGIIYLESKNSQARPQ